MIVNTASECGLTPQYKQLQELYDTYGGQNFVTLVFQQITLRGRSLDQMNP